MNKPGTMRFVDKFNCASELDRYREMQEKPSSFTANYLNEREQLQRVFRIKEKGSAQSQLIHRRPICNGYQVDERQQFKADDYTFSSPANDHVAALVSSRSSFVHLPQCVMEQTSTLGCSDTYAQFREQREENIKVLSHLQAENDKIFRMNYKSELRGSELTECSEEEKQGNFRLLLNADALVANANLAKRAVYYQPAISNHRRHQMSRESAENPH